jgi:dGTPase
VNTSALAPWACHPERSRGRRVAEASAAPRSEHQRDRDRIVHSAAFRRLVYKTQVFLNHEGDLFRTRLTHSLEVAQIARSAARRLRLNEDLVEAIALAHDLGHTPFGHAGQDALHERLQALGTAGALRGFEHNAQSLRVVDRLEQRYFAFDGLNLCFETREGILKHCSAALARRLCESEPAGPAQRFLTGGEPSLEAQLVNLADEVAYTVHDIDDGLRSGLLDAAALGQVPLYAHHLAMARTRGGAVGGAERRLRAEAQRSLLSALIEDLVQHTTAALTEAAPADCDAVRAAPPLVCFGPAMRGALGELKRFLFRSLYRHPQVSATTGEARTVIGDLFDIYLAQPGEMSGDFQATSAQARPSARPRVVADYVAGMTDRFATREHERLTGRRLFGA